MTGAERTGGPVEFPFAVDRHGGTARTGPAEHLRDLVQQVLFTAAGERVNRPDFGAGLAQLLFAAATPEVAATTRMLVQGTLQQWLGDVIDVLGVQTAVDDTLVVVEVAYRERRTGASGLLRVTQPGSAS